jgi:hypothetical protein
MSRLTQLPTELRQQILLLALPDTNRIGSSTQVLRLFHIDKLLREDMATVVALWSPLHYISHPTALSSPMPRTLNWKIDRICLDLFYTSDIKRMACICYCYGPETWTHPELIAAWADAVPLLPAGVKEVWLDVTPAPAEKRNKHRMILNLWVNDRRVSEAFLGGHVDDVAALVKRIDQHYGGSAQVLLTGTLTPRCQWYLPEVNEMVGREMKFQGTSVSAEEARFASIDDGVRRITSRKKEWQGKRRGDRHPLSWLHVVTWDERTKFLYAALAFEGMETAALDDLKKIADFRDGEGELALPPTSKMRRAFQHRVAADMGGLKTVGVGEGDDRHVVVSL